MVCISFYREKYALKTGRVLSKSPRKKLTKPFLQGHFSSILTFFWKKNEPGAKNTRNWGKVKKKNVLRAPENPPIRAQIWISWRGIPPLNVSILQSTVCFPWNVFFWSGNIRHFFNSICLDLLPCRFSSYFWFFFDLFTHFIFIQK